MWTATHPWTGCHLPPWHIPRGHEKKGKRSALRLFSVIQKSLRHSHRPPSGATKAITGLLRLPCCPIAAVGSPHHFPSLARSGCETLHSPRRSLGARSPIQCHLLLPPTPAPPEPGSSPGELRGGKQSWDSPPARVTRHKTHSTKRT